MRRVELLIGGGQGAVLRRIAGVDVDGAAAFSVDVLGDVGQQREVTERADHRDRLVDVDAVEHPRHLGALDLRTTHPERRDPRPLDQIEDLVAVLLADGVAEDRAEQPNVFTHRLGGLAAYPGALYRAEGLKRVGCFSHTYQYRGGWPSSPFVAQALYLIRSAIPTMATSQMPTTNNVSRSRFFSTTVDPDRLD